MKAMAIDSAKYRLKYPHLRFSRMWEVSGELHYLLGQCDALVSSLGTIPLLPEARRDLLLVSLKKGAQATTAIEGNTLSEDEISSVVEGHPGVQEDGYQEREVRNIVGALNELLQELAVRDRAQRISPLLLQRLHYLVGRDLGGQFRAVPGQFASASRVVGGYRAPAKEDVEDLVEIFCAWLQEEFHYPSQTFAQATIQAVVAHVYLEWIHPFDDGNGRTGRLVEFYILVRAGLPDITSHLLANHYNETRSEYYRQLQAANDSRDLTQFLKYAIQGFFDGLKRTLADVHTNLLRQMWRIYVYDTFSQVQMRQKGTFLRQRALALALPLDRPVTYSDIPSLTAELGDFYSRAPSASTVTRDVQQLERHGLIERNAALISAKRDVLERSLPVRRPSGVANQGVPTARPPADTDPSARTPR
ncbi:MAG: Fic family protein [Gemmatimonadaceae bacterium]|nr:Fic family protein [Gemmatimonadaceae bacterium]